MEAASQTGWETTTGGPLSEQHPLCVAVTGSMHAVVAGRAGKIFVTDDGGYTWVARPAGSTEDFDGISFSDDRRGTIVGSTHTAVLRTDDGGRTWRRQGTGLPDSAGGVNSVAFSDSLNGVIATLSGRMYHTGDGGGSWTIATPQLSRDVLRVRLRGSYGLAVGYMGDTYRTSDGGRNWFYHSALTGGRTFRDVFLLDSLNAVAVGDAGLIRTTHDGGILWTAVSAGVAADFRTVTFLDGLNGIIGTGDGGLLRTTDGGTSWSSPQPSPMPAIREVAFGPASFGLCVTGAGGNSFRTSDGGLSWEEMEYSWRGSYHGLCALNPDSLFSVGGRGRIAFSSDYGSSWRAQSPPTSATLRDVSFDTPLDGWVVGDSGVILHTSDGGASWVRQQGNTPENLHGVSHAGSGIGIAGGDNNTLLRTGDGGVTWTPLYSPFFDHWRAVSFVNPWEGVAAGRDGSLIKTTDGGATWNLVYSALGLEDVSHPDADHIYAVGRLAGDLLHGVVSTTDGGNSWTPHILGGWEITGVSFANPRIGAVAGSGGIFSTQDSGKNWTLHTPSQSAFRAISASGSRAAMAVGDSGVTARLRNAGSIGGVWFHDLNSDKTRNPGEGGLGGRTILLGGRVIDSAVTGMDGRYDFTSLPYGSYTLRPGNIPFWEQTTPPLFTADTVRIGYESEEMTYRDIGFAGPLVRLRIPILVTDNNVTGSRVVWCGIRPGATRAIWGSGPGASRVDSAEGEFELPPRSFSEFAGIMDARFSDPYLPLNEYSEVFGEGSWSDVRPYSSPGQKDTFLLSFLPGYIFGGNYPITLRWPGEIVTQSFSGPVRLVDFLGSVTDMKTNSQASVTDNNIKSLLIVTDSPEIPDAWLTKWRLISLPAPVADGSIGSLFPSAATRGYTFTPGVGYEALDTLRPNTGYWLKYPPAIDTLSFDPSSRRSDTVSLFRGWNLIGALSVPVAAGSITTDPPDLAPGYIFSFEEGYEVTDSLLPGKAYWIHAGGEGRLFLDAGISKASPHSRSRAGYGGSLDAFTAVRIEDAGGDASVIYLSGEDGADVSKYLLPPSPPPGVFDVRHGSERLAETVREGSAAEYPVLISSARFPVSVSLPRPTSLAVSVRVGGKILPLRQDGAITIHDGGAPWNTAQGQRHVLTLVVSGHSGEPAEYALRQNYPNPFNPATLISFILPVRSRVKIRVFDVMGREVAVLIDGVAEAGHGSVSWDSRDAASGVYFYRMEAVSLSGAAGSFSDVKKMVVLR